MQNPNKKYCVSKFSSDKNCLFDNYIPIKSFNHTLTYLSPGKLFQLLSNDIYVEKFLVKHSILILWNAIHTTNAGFDGETIPAFINFSTDSGDFRADGDDFRADGDDFRADGSDFGADGSDFKADGGDFGADAGDFSGTNSVNNMFFHKFNIFYFLNFKNQLRKEKIYANFKFYSSGRK